MIQFARAIGLEVSLATFGMLEDVFLKIGRKTGRNVGEKGSGRPVSLSRSGSTVIESVASRSFHSLPTITESFDGDRLAGDLSQQPCSSRQADAVLDFSRTEVTEINDTDSLKTLGQIRSDARKKGELYRWSREGRPNLISPSGSDGGGYVFTEEMLEIAPLAKIFATGPEIPFKNRHCSYCMICRRNVSMKSRGLYELKGHFQREHHLRADQRFRARHHPSKIRGSGGLTLYGSKLEAEKKLFTHLDVPELDHKRPFYYDVVEGKPFIFTSASSRTLIQIELLLIFLRGGGQLWTEALLSAISGDATIICCGGSNANFVKVLNKSPGRKAGVQYPFALAPMQFDRLLHKPSFSVMGRIDMCSMLRALLLRLNGLLDERWVLSTQYFRMVHIGKNCSWLP